MTTTVYYSGQRGANRRLNLQCSLTTRLLRARPAPSTPYERMRWQQQHARHDIIGYAVGLASERTVRAAYLTTAGELTNNEKEAAVLSKEKASILMGQILTSEKLVEWTRWPTWRIAFLVPVSSTLPLTMCTFMGH